MEEGFIDEKDLIDPAPIPQGDGDRARFLGVMDELVVVEVVSTEPEAELLCSLLRTEGIKCTYRQSNYGAGASDGMPVGGPQEVIVRAEDLTTAREVLREQ